LTTKERELFFTLKVILEIEMKGYVFPRGVDFNNSEVKNFKIENNKILIPFTAVNGIGEKAGEKITAYRQEKGKIVNWKDELEKLLNKNHVEQLENLAKYNLIIDE
jgi:DNA polymerase III alpha subunit (gram-positive type)